MVFFFYLGFFFQNLFLSESSRNWIKNFLIFFKFLVVYLCSEQKFRSNTKPFLTLFNINMLVFKEAALWLLHFISMHYAYCITVVFICITKTICWKCSKQWKLKWQDRGYTSVNIYLDTQKDFLKKNKNKNRRRRPPCFWPWLWKRQF